MSDTPLYDALLADRIARALAQDARRQLIADAVVAATVVAADEEAVERLPPPMPSVAELFAHNPGTSRALDALLGGASRV